MVPMFKNAGDEQVLFKVLKAYVEEWAAQNVLVILPERWRSFCPTNVGLVPVAFSHENSVRIVAGLFPAFTSFEVPLTVETENNFDTSHR